MSLINMLNNLDVGRDLIVESIKFKGIDISAESTLKECADAIRFITTGDGYITSDANITSDDVLLNKIAYGANGRVIGNIPTVTPNVNDNIITISKGYLSQNETITIPVAQTPVINNNVIKVFKGYNTNDNEYTLGKAISGYEITPTTENQVIEKDSYLTGPVIVFGDTKLVSSNIKKGVSIFGVEGTMDAKIDTTGTATNDDLLLGKIAYVNDEKIVGTIKTVTPVVSNNTISISKGYLSESKTYSVGNAIGGKEILPTTENQVIEKDSYLLENIVILGDKNLKPEVIKANTTIFGVKGTYSGGEGIPYELGVIVEENGELKYQGLSFNESVPSYSGISEDFIPYIYNILGLEPDYSNIKTENVINTKELEAGILIEKDGQLVIQPISYNGIEPNYESEVEDEYEVVSFETISDEPNYGVGSFEKEISDGVASSDNLLKEIGLDAGVIVGRNSNLYIQQLNFNGTIPSKFEAPISKYNVKIFETKENEPVYGGLDYIEKQ